MITTILKKNIFFLSSIVNKMSYGSSCSSQYSETYNALDCYEFATIGEMNGVSGALAIPASTAQRFFQTPSTINAQGQVQNPMAPEVAEVVAATGVAPAAIANVAAAAGVSPAVIAQFIRSNRRF